MQCPPSLSSLPVELICAVMDFLTFKERVRTATVSRHTLAGYRDTKVKIRLTCNFLNAVSHPTQILELAATPSLVKAGLGNIVRRFPRLQCLSLRLKSKSEEDMEAVVHAGMTFTGHQGLVHLISDTSSILRGARFCPKLRSIQLCEDFTMPIPHLLDMAENGVNMVFRKLPSVTDLEIDCPLLWAVNRFSHWRQDEDMEMLDSPVSPTTPTPNTENISIWNLEKLIIRSLHNDSINDLMVGLMKRAYFSNLTSMCLEGDDAIFPQDSILWISQACPVLSDVSFSSLHFGEEYNTMLRMLPQGLTSFSLSMCQVPVHRYDGTDNMALELLIMALATFPDLKRLELMHCKFARTNAPLQALLYAGASMDAFPENNLQHLTLLGFGKNMPEVAFLSYLYALHSLKVDDVPHFITLRNGTSITFSALLDPLEHLQDLEVRYTRVSTRNRSAREWARSYIPPDHRLFSNDGTWNDSMVESEGAMDIYPPTLSFRSDKLQKLALYAPLFIDATLSAIQNTTRLTHLKLSYVNIDGDSIGLLSHPISLPFLKVIQLHVHGWKSDEMALVTLCSLISASSMMQEIRVQATRSMYDDEDDSSAPSSSTESVKSNSPKYLVDNQTIESIARSCPRLNRLALVGFSLEVSALVALNGDGEMIPWRETLSSFEVSIAGIPQLDFQYDILLTSFLKAHPLLKTIEICIESFSALHNEFLASNHLPQNQSRPTIAPAAEANPQESATVNEIRLRDALNLRLAKIYEEELRKRVWWLEEVKVMIPSLRSQRVRSFLLRRIASNSRRAPAAEPMEM
ncbi:hypothetical protein HDU97_008299 [Phlyctochytrium planicorne]|nr:hypothetical protein HDU97_008299 [Phlyctochytrium planicorne]